MKNTLLISTAVAALLAGLGLASAQAPMQPPMQQQQPAAAQPSAPAVSVEQKAGAAVDVKATEKPAKGQAAGKAKTETSGQAAAPKAQEQNKAQGAQKQDSAKDAQSKPSTDAKTSGSGTAQGQSSGTAAAPEKAGSGSSTASGSSSGSASASINLSVEQKNRVRETVIRSSNAPRLSNVNFSINVGTVVPRRVRFAPLPPLLIEIHPAWRGYQYFLVGDQIVVVDPRTLRIVAVLDV